MKTFHFFFKQTCVVACFAWCLTFLHAEEKGGAPSSLLNASYDTGRDIFKAINKGFEAEWKRRSGSSGATVTVRQSHAGSSKQARAVMDGLPADVVTLSQVQDMEALRKAGLVAADWRGKFPHGSSPWTSRVCFVVRKGNPKKIVDWDDLAKPGVQVVLINPQTSGVGRWAYLAAAAYAEKKFKSQPDQARDWMRRLYQNTPTLDTGGRAATNTFAQRGIGDALVTTEAEIDLISRELGMDALAIVKPSVTVEALYPVAILEKNAKAHGTTALAQAYLEFLFSSQGQKIAAENGYRPRLKDSATKAVGEAVEIVDVEKQWGGWDAIYHTHFEQGALFDQIYTKRR